MSKFNTTATRPATFSPVTSEAIPSGRTFEGGPGHARDAKSELFLLAVANMVGEDTFYEGKGERDERFRSLIHSLAVADPDWLARMLTWLRGEGNMRSAPIVGACEMVKARLDAGLAGGGRQVIDAVCQRPDEPGEVLAYWTSRYGRAIPKPIKRGVADAVARLYTERSLLKYDTNSKGFRFGDVIDLVHPNGGKGDLYRHALDRRHNREDRAIPEGLDLLRAHAFLASVPVAERRGYLTPNALGEAGMTWESVAGWLQGPMDAQAWQAIIPSMGYMALLRNLRNFDEAGVPDDVAATVAAKLSDPEQVARSRQLPMRFLSAYKAAPSLRWAYAIEQALNLSLSNVPALAGRTLVLVDRSGSMQERQSSRSELTRGEAAAIFGTALAVRCEQPALVQFGTTSAAVPLVKGASVLRTVERFGWLGGTNTEAAVRQWYSGQDRVVIVTDEQASYYSGDPSGAVPATVPLYTWNLAGYQHGHGPSGSANRHTFGGLTDAAFRMIPLIEAGRSATWPF